MQLLSVIISTSPNRENNLRLCLEMLQRQLFQQFEVIVVDDGSVAAQTVVFEFNSGLNLTYHWRPNDCCVSRSRNIGVGLSRQNFLVFVDSDLLLNPEALQYYYQLLKSDYRKKCLFYGYYGYSRESQGPSQWFPSRWVNWADNRFSFELNRQFRPHPNLFKYPQNFAWSGNFATHRAIYEDIFGFNEQFIGWGDEDLDFGIRACQVGYQVHFALNPWAEHLSHSLTEDFHRPSDRLYIPDHQTSTYPVLVHRTPEVEQIIAHHIFEYYLPNNIQYLKCHSLSHS